jgi:MFS family permease
MGQRAFFYGWTVLGAAALVTCVGMGTMFSLGVFLKPIEESTGWSRTGISTIALLNWVFMGVGSFLWGALSDRIGTRFVVLAGGALLGLGLVLSSQATALGHLQVTFGAMVGLGVGAFYAPLTATATRWFVARRGLAVGIVSAGIGLGVMLVSPLTRWLASDFGWRAAMVVLGDLAWLLIIPAALLIREQPSDVGATALGEGASVARLPERSFTGAQVLRTPQFWVIALTHFACCAAHAGPIFHMVTHTIDQGIATMTAATVFSVSGFASIGGRLLTGALADRLGAKPTLLAGLALQVAAILGYLVVREVGAFYGLALVFGLAYGGVMPLYALVVREYFGDRVMGTAYGAVFLVSTLGMGLGSFAGGYVFDTLGSYAWLFVGSAAIGTAGGMLAVMFRPPGESRAPVPAIAG